MVCDDSFGMYNSESGKTIIEIMFRAGVLHAGK